MRLSRNQNPSPAHKKRPFFWRRTLSFGTILKFGKPSLPLIVLSPTFQPTEPSLMEGAIHNRRTPYEPKHFDGCVYKRGL